MAQFKTIHIFAYGETQLIGGENDGKLASSTLTTQQALIDHIKGFMPADVLDMPYHAIHLHYGSKASYLGRGEALKEKTSFHVSWDQLDATLIDALSDELAAALV
jgi:hypothetical protein